MQTVRWGMLSTADIGRLVVAAARRSRRAEFVAVASRDADRARRFADDLGIPRSFGSYEDLLADDDIDAVYVALPVALHTEWTVKALEAGKHVLCEKPFAMTAADAARSFDAAETAGRTVVEGLMYRHHPQTTRARRLVAEGAIGRLGHVRAALSVSVGPDDIRRSPRLGGGALLDLGCYCVSAIRLFAGEPRRLSAHAVLDRDQADGRANVEPVDLRLCGVLEMPDDILASFDVGLDLERRDELVLVGTDGVLVVPDPWLCRTGYVALTRGGHTERLAADPDDGFDLAGDDSDAYRIEFDVVSTAIADGSVLAYGREDAVAQAGVLQALRRTGREVQPAGASMR